MTETIIVAIITSVVTLIGIYVSYRTAVSKMQQSIETQQAVMQTEIKQIKEDVKEHNHYSKLFAETMPVIREQIKVINHRIDDLEKGSKHE